MPLIQLKEVTLRYHAHPLLEKADFQIDPGERVCLLGRNGTGKTSLMRLMVGQEKPDSGEIIRSSATQVRWLPQDVPDGIEGRVREVVAEGVRADHHEEPWETDVRIDELLAEMGLPENDMFSGLSGGWKRRVLLAKALIGQPDLLLLDEPTNHLDLDSILWLEHFLPVHAPAIFFVTHDRAFLRKVATRIVELDRGQLTSWNCDYDNFLLRKAAALEAEEKQRANFDKKLAQEEAWLRQGVKARRTRNEGRVRALEQMRRDRQQRRERVGQAQLGIQEGALSGQKVIELESVSFGYGESKQVVDFSTVVWRGDKIGLVGPNGAGKTTLLKLLLGRLEPQSGTVKQGTNLQVVYLDQLRDQIDDEKTLAQNVAGSAETVLFQERSMHIHGYLRQFLFDADQVRAPAKWLSGGERNRLLLARLFLQPANVLVLDEPTNDLDLETLELLEDLLVNYKGTLLLVSHDRAFLDNVVTSTFIFQGDGVIREVNGTFSDWENWQQKEVTAPVVEEIKSKPKESKVSVVETKMLNREKRELEELPRKIEAMEEEHAAWISRMVDPKELARDPAGLVALQKQVEELERQMEEAYARWQELEKVRVAVEGK